MNKQITLICTPLKFYTDNDETLCFEWIKKIQCINEYHGAGRTLYLSIKSINIANKDLLDLIGLFERYKFDSTQLKIFMNDTNQDWFEE